MQLELDEILKQVNKIFINVLDNDSILLNNETVANDIDEWDSLTHVQLIVATERYFKIKFTSSEIRSFRNVGHFCEMIKIKLENNE